MQLYFLPLCFKRQGTSTYTTLISTQVSPLYSLHIYESVTFQPEYYTRYSQYFILLNLARHYPYTLLVSVPICLPCNPTLTTYRQCQGTSFNIRIFTVLGRFYYGISRHSIQFILQKAVALSPELLVHQKILFLNLLFNNIIIAKRIFL